MLIIYKLSIAIPSPQVQAEFFYYVTVQFEIGHQPAPIRYLKQQLTEPGPHSEAIQRISIILWK